jgi:toxin ParE1/3/4
MRKIRLHSLAESDLIDIWLHSFEEWNGLQADKYLDELNTAINSLASNPELGVRRDNVREGYRALFVNRHAIYYRFTPSTVEIVRVLHGQMDPERHLGDSENPE